MKLAKGSLKDLKEDEIKANRKTFGGIFTFKICRIKFFKYCQSIIASFSIFTIKRTLS